MNSYKRLLTGLVGVLLIFAINTGAEAQTKGERIQQLEQKLKILERRLEATAAAVAQARAPKPEEDRVSVHGYGSVRYEANTLDKEQDTFTYRRFVLALDAQVTDRLRTYFELEFERFRKLELEKEVVVGTKEIEFIQAVEGTNQSEIAIEQAWASYTISPALKIQAGAVLVPLGRFNLYHDDNQWNLNRRPLIDRGAPALPVKTAWAELGVGLLGTIPVGDSALLDYRFYVVNGANLSFELETEVEGVGGEENTVIGILEAEVQPFTGSFSEDLNDNKAITGRVALRPAPGQEIALSGYWGRYTPAYLPDESVWSIGIDGLHHLGGFEVEYEAVYTRFEGIKDVAEAFAAQAFNQEGEIVENGEGGFEAVITLAPNAIAESRSGYWVAIRYPFWPQFLNGTFLARSFSNPQLVPTLRLEQVFLNDQLRGFEFAGGEVEEFETADATLNRATLGLAYRPVPQWVFTVAGVYTWTNEDSLAGLTNYYVAQPGEDHVFALTVGMAFGF